jgi:hypothetical protein
MRRRLWLCRSEDGGVVAQVRAPEGEPLGYIQAFLGDDPRRLCFDLGAGLAYSPALDIYYPIRRERA